MEGELTEKVVQINRVSKKTKGGNRISFSALIVVGDRKGQVGVGLGKAADVARAIRKGIKQANKHLIKVPLKGTTIGRTIRIKRGAAKIIIKPALPGRGIVAGGAVRVVIEAVGVKDISAKILGTRNRTSNVYATMEALKELRDEA